MNLLYPKEARQLIAKLVPWVKGDEFNHVTFDALVNEKLLPIVKRVPDGTRFFTEDAVRDLVKRFPKIRPANRIGIVGWLKGKRPKAVK